MGPHIMASPPVRNVLCVGIAVLDNMFSVEAVPAEPTKTFAQNFCQVGGGPASNGAVTIARLGGHARFWGRVGDDALGHQVNAEIGSYGVDVSTVRHVPGGRTGVSAVIVDKNGERQIFAFADRTLDQSTDWLPRVLPDGLDAVLCDVRWAKASAYVMALAKPRGLPVVLDADLTIDDAVERLIGNSTHAVFSAPALRKLSGTDAIEAGLKAAQALTDGSVSVTLGSDGFAWLENGAVKRIPAYRVEVVDTLAAGDVFHGAFALALAERRPIGEAGRFASAAAALKCTRWGGRLGIPTRAELDRFMAEAA